VAQRQSEEFGCGVRDQDLEGRPGPLLRAGWDDVELEFPDGQRVEVDLTRSFWKPETPCAELRNAAIG
jgi:hypothetical protein